MCIDYNHSQNLHTVTGAKAGLSAILDGKLPESLLDVGCGTGTWARAAQDFGISDVFGVDGIEIAEDQFLISKDHFSVVDLTMPLKLSRKFEVALCLEVAEHLELSQSDILISSLADSADTVFFSAACPGQPGQHHVNCHWPCYWQELFNAHGFVCDDAIRWRIWDDLRIEPWYRQNIFTARRDPLNAGHERRLASVIHPEIVPYMIGAAEQINCSDIIERIEHGSMPMFWYLSSIIRAMGCKIRRRLN